MDDTLNVEPLDRPGRCTLCHRVLPSEIEANYLEVITSICGDCKFLFLEGTQDIEQRTPSVRQTGSESIENMFPDMINLDRHNQPTSTRTTPSGSRRWRRVSSDTESDGFDSVYGDSDIFSYAAYGGDSDASVDVDSFLDNNTFAHPDAASDVDSDTDIDPMHVGLSQWESDEDENDEAENTLESLVGTVQLRRSLATNGRNLPVDWLSEIHSPESEGGAVGIRISERRQETSGYVGNIGDYVDARGFEELLERLSETDITRGAGQPAAVWFVKNLERVVVDEKVEEGSLCAICKDSLCVGSTVSRLPCLHVYHPSCIEPWLNARNTCPLCRYEVPTEGRREEDEDMNNESRRWWFIAAPIVSVVGIGFVLWLGEGMRGGFLWASQRDNRSRRWWPLF